MFLNWEKKPNKKRVGKGFDVFFKMHWLILRLVCTVEDMEPMHWAILSMVSDIMMRDGVFAIRSVIAVRWLFGKISLSLPSGLKKTYSWM